jgi:hypothetical protein
MLLFENHGGTEVTEEKRTLYREGRNGFAKGAMAISSARSAKNLRARWVYWALRARKITLRVLCEPIASFAVKYFPSVFSVPPW